jgi:hypothetical protein
MIKNLKYAPIFGAPPPPNRGAIKSLKLRGFEIHVTLNSIAQKKFSFSLPNELQKRVKKTKLLSSENIRNKNCTATSEKLLL